MDTKENTMTVGKHTLAYGGGTFNRDGTVADPETGYAVGLVPGTAKIVYAGGAITSDQRAYLIDKGFERVRQDFPDAPFIGTWTGPGGAIHIDPVMVVLSLTTALQLAREKGQEAIWSFANSEEIPV